MIHRTPAQEVAEQYDVELSTVYTWYDEVRASRLKEVEEIEIGSLITDMLADENERIRLLYQYTDSSDCSERHRMDAYKEIRLIWASRVGLFRETKAFEAYAEKLG